MNIKGLIVHHSDSPHRGNTIEDIHKWHLKAGFDGCGYHYVILEDGQVQKGRPNFWDGSHAKGYNDTHLGICLMGVDYFTPEQFYALKDLINSLILEFKISIENILGHYQVSNKTCPNFDVKQWISENFS